MKPAEQKLWTFALDSKTAIRKSGKTITAAELKPGDLVLVRYLDYEGKATAMAIQVNPRTASDGSSKEAEPPQLSQQEDCERRVIHTAQVLAKSYGGDPTITPRARQDAKTLCQQMGGR